MWPLIKKAYENLDLTFAVIGAFITFFFGAWLVFGSLRLLYFIALAMIFITCALYVKFHRRIIESYQQSVETQLIGKKRTFLILNTGFFILLSLSIVVLYVRDDIYARPSIYFIIIALMSSILAIEIFYKSSNYKNDMFILIKILIITISVTFSQQLIFPGSLVGIDPWTYESYTEGMLASGHIIPRWEYSNLPLFNLITGQLSLISGLNYKFSSMLSVGLIQITCDLFFIYLIGRHLWNAKVGLMAALLLGMAVMHISEGIAPIATTYATTMMVMAVFLLLKNERDRSLKIITLFLAASIALILTHTITAACMAVILLCFWIWPIMSNKLLKKKESQLTSSSVFALFCVGMLGWWIYASGLWLDIVNVVKWAYRLDFIGGLTPGPTSTILDEYVKNIPLLTKIFQDLGMFVFFSIAIFGCLILFSRHITNNGRSTMAVSGTLLLIIGFLPFASAIGLMSRWWYYAEIIMAPMVGASLFIGIQTIKKYQIRAIALGLITFVLVSIMILNPFANFDSPAFSNETSIRYALTQSEVEGIGALTHISTGIIATDEYYHYVISRNNTNTIDISQRLVQNNFTALNGKLVVFRLEISDSPFWCLGSTYRVKYDLQQSADAQGLFKIYDSRTVTAFCG